MSKENKKIFVSYPHKDKRPFEVFLDNFKSHLKSSRKYDFDTWDDSKILPGIKWHLEIQENLEIHLTY